MACRTRIACVVVDDSPQMRAAMVDMLREVPGCVVVGEGASGLEALALVHSLRPDLLVMDVHMPHMGGLEALEALKVESRDMRVVLVTAALDPEVRQWALELGAAECLEKGPSLQGQLRAMVCALQAQAGFTSPLRAARDRSGLGSKDRSALQGDGVCGAMSESP